MSAITKTTLNSPAVQKFYESQLTANSHGPRRTRGGIQEGAGLLDLINGLATNVSRAVVAGRRLERARKTKTPKRRSKAAASSQQTTKKRSGLARYKSQRRQPIKRRWRKNAVIRSQTGKVSQRPRKSSVVTKRRTKSRKVTI